MADRFATPHDYVGEEGGSCRAQIKGSPCGYSADHGVHTQTQHPNPGFGPALAATMARRREARSAPWRELPSASKAIASLFGLGAGSVFLAGCAALSHWLLHIGGLL